MMGLMRLRKFSSLRAWMRRSTSSRYCCLTAWYAKNPDHPGLAHYLIHSYDYPSLAENGLPMAQSYAQIAPWVPHALHMPSHIFTRLGMWNENIDSNLASAAAAQR